MDVFPFILPALVLSMAGVWLFRPDPALRSRKVRRLYLPSAVLAALIAVMSALVQDWPFAAVFGAWAAVDAMVVLLPDLPPDFAAWRQREATR